MEKLEHMRALEISLLYEAALHVIAHSLLAKP